MNVCMQYAVGLANTECREKLLDGVGAVGWCLGRSQRFSPRRVWQMVPRVIQASYTTYTGSYHHTQDCTAKHIIYTAVQWLEGYVWQQIFSCLRQSWVCLQLASGVWWLSVVIIVLQPWCKQIWKLASLAAACPGATKPILLIIIVSHV